MRRATTKLSITGLVALTALGTGCVQQDRYDTLLQANRSLKEQNVRLADERDAALTSVRTMQGELSQARGQMGSLETRNTNLSGDLDRMAGDYDQLLNQVSTLDIGPLPPDVEMALDDLARTYPALLTFDSQAGMLRFSSDLSFALGSAELQPEAEATIASVADVFNSDTARNLEVRVVGHTDNVPIGKPETRRNHPTNLHLSVHRAIAVRNALTAAGVEPTRILVAGYGEFQPIVPNGRRGAAANRRVELFLAPAPDTAAMMPVQETPGAPEVYPDPMK